MKAYLLDNVIVFASHPVPSGQELPVDYDSLTQDQKDFPKLAENGVTIIADEELCAARDAIHRAELLEMTIRQYEQAVQSILDSVAKKKGYESADRLATYANPSGSDPEELEGNAFKEWRKQVWRWCYAEQQKYLPAPDTAPSPSKFVELLLQAVPAPW